MYNLNVDDDIKYIYIYKAKLMSNNDSTMPVIQYI